jgi:septal ring factor EnvC (AmiA/AmiB activator)
MPALAAEATEPEAVRSALDESVAHRAELDREVERLSGQALALRARTIAAAQAIQSQEDALTTSEAELARLRQEAAAKKEVFQERRRDLVALLAALERMARRPPESLIAMPAPPQDVMRGAAVLRAVLPPLNDKVEALRGDLAQLARLGDQIAQGQRTAKARAAALESRRADLDALLARTLEMRKQAQTRSAAEAERVRKLAAKAADLGDLVGRLDADTAKAQEEQDVGPAAAPEAPEAAPEAALEAAPEQQQLALAPAPADRAPILIPPKPFSQEKGRIRFPARGTIVHKFGERGDGPKSRGIVISTRAEAQVVAPYDGRVAFAGPFRGYGQLLIISQGEGYHVLLAGLSRIDCVVGQWLLAGEPVGVMGPAENGDPQLYIELRHDGEPINPLPWLAARDEKVSG